MKINKVFYPTVFLLFLAILPFDAGAQNARQIFYEDCEDTTFTEHFLERYYGTGYQSYWTEFTSEILRSDQTPHSGHYCMTYDPWTTGNPHAVLGYAGAKYGNTSHFDLSSYNQRYWYFRWYQRWETGINWSGSAQNKLLYINYRDSGDFVVTLSRNDSSNFHITIKDHDTYSIVVNDWLTNPGGNLDNMQWHKLELFIDAGTTGNNNGRFWFKVDDILLKEALNIRFSGTIHPNPIHHLTGWPSNTSGTPSGTSNTWLDDLEIWDGVPGTTFVNSSINPVPDKFFLKQNYPNPFGKSHSFGSNLSTKIKYSIAKASRAQIIIYNRLGQKILTLLNKQLNVGEHSVTWQGVDTNGHSVSCGIYFYRLKAGQQVLTKKMLYLR